MSTTNRRIGAARRVLAGLGLLGVATLSACWSQAPLPKGPSTFDVTVTRVTTPCAPSGNCSMGKTVSPTAADPLPANRGDHDDAWDFTVQAVSPSGEPTHFNGVVRVTVDPGDVIALLGDHTYGRNLQLVDGQASGTAIVSAVYGPARLWIEDLGYVPEVGNGVPACSDGKDNDHDGLIDYPADPGCAYANDTTETGGTFAAGASQPIQYSYPTVVDVQGQASTTPYPNDAVELDTTPPHTLVVTRVSSDGFYVTDLDKDAVATGYNAIYAFNFSTPEDMRVCDIVTYLAGTANDFYGFTELSFPSYQLADYDPKKVKCLVPEPTVLIPCAVMGCVDSDNPIKGVFTSTGGPDDSVMEKLESGLVRLTSGLQADGMTTINWTLPTKLGPAVVMNGTPSATATNCDLNGDGSIDYTDAGEGGCSTTCDADPECSEWTSFASRSEIKVHGVIEVKDSSGQPHQLPDLVVQIDLSTATDFDPTINKGLTLESVTGTLREFSGGSLNWTVEARCVDDLVCTVPGCSPALVSMDKACVVPRTTADNNQGSN